MSVEIVVVICAMVLLGLIIGVICIATGDDV